MASVPGRHRSRHAAPVVVSLVMSGLLFACTTRTPFAGLLEARRLAADLQVEFTRAADAANRAVMADTDEASVTFAREASASIDAVQKDVDKLSSVLTESGFSQEAGQLQDFRTR